MRNPFIKYLPERIQKSLLYRFYYPVAEKWLGLFESADLRYAPGFKMKLLATDLMHASIAFTGSYESGFSERVCELSKSSGGLMVDVGANAGYFPLLWTSANSRSRCIAFEPSPRNVELILENMRKNGVNDRVSIKDIALGNSSGEAQFDLGPKEQTGWGGVSLVETPQSIKVRIERLDTILAEEAIIDLLKIDTEGADTWVLMGGRDLLLAKKIKEIRYEQNKTRMKLLGIQESEAEKFLESVGYFAEAVSDKAKDIVEWRAVPAGASAQGNG
jgi:FkbM family methyltransferase